MTKLCPRGKAAAKRKFKVYPSAYANAYASKICAGKIKDPSGVKRKDFRGPKPSKAMGGRIYKAEGGVSLQERATERKKLIEKSKPSREKIGVTKPGKRPNIIRMTPEQKEKRFDTPFRPKGKSVMAPKPREIPRAKSKTRIKRMGGGMTMMPRAMYKKGGKSFPDLSGDGKVTMKDILMGRGVIQRPKKKGGGLMEATSRLRAQGLKKGGIARGCGAVMSDRRKKTKMY
jgi:hypothetical protein